MREARRHHGLDIGHGEAASAASLPPLASSCRQRSQLQGGTKAPDSACKFSGSLGGRWALIIPEAAELAAAAQMPDQVTFFLASCLLGWEPIHFDCFVEIRGKLYFLRSE